MKTYAEEAAANLVAANGPESKPVLSAHDLALAAIESLKSLDAERLEDLVRRCEHARWLCGREEAMKARSAIRLLDLLIAETGRHLELLRRVTSQDGLDSAGYPPPGAYGCSAGPQGTCGGRGVWSGGIEDAK